MLIKTKRAGQSLFRGVYRLVWKTLRLATFGKWMHVTVCVLAERDGRVLTVQNSYLNVCRPVTGFVEDGELPEQSALRELKEETGFDGNVAKLLGVYQVGRQVRNLVIVYVVKLNVLSGQPIQGEEVIVWKELASLIKEEKDSGFLKIYSDYAKILPSQKS